MVALIIVLIWLLSIGVCAMVAQSRQNDVRRACLFGFLFGPLGILFCLLE